MPAHIAPTENASPGEAPLDPRRGFDVDVSSTARRLVPLFGDMRNHQRMQLALSGSVARLGAAAAPCVTRDISEGGAALESALACAIGEALTLQFEGLGALDAEVARVFPGGFAVAFALAPQRRAEITEALGVLWSRSPLSLIEVSFETAEDDAL